MADLWLGPTGSEVLLPPPNWISGSPGDYPTAFKKNYESATMLDGRIRYNFKSFSPRSWAIEWAMLEKSDITVLQALADLRQTLRFSTGLSHTAAWASVVVGTFSFAPVLQTFREGLVPFYRATMTLEEVV